MFFLRSFDRLLVRFLYCLIRGYQIFISPIIGSHCRFQPTCSNYALLALKNKGFIVGLFLASQRILKCNPFHPGGHDAIK